MSKTAPEIEGLAASAEHVDANCPALMTSGLENPQEGSTPPGNRLNEGLAKKLKEGTKDAHCAAERVHYVHEFIKGNVTRKTYKQMLINLYHVYKALEEALEKCWEHPLVEPLHFPEELQRLEALRADVEFFWGPSWQDEAEPSPVTVEYVTRLREIARTSPELIVPHAYTRYLGDLSGGQVLKRAAVRGLKLSKEDESGVRFYVFRRIRDIKAFKNMYRARLDALPVDVATADAMVTEANYAFSLNTRMFHELDDLAGFTDLPLPPCTLAASPAKFPGETGVAEAARCAGCPFAALIGSGMDMELPENHVPVHGYSHSSRVPAAAASSISTGTNTAVIAQGDKQQRGGLAILQTAVVIFMCSLPVLWRQVPQ